MKNIIQHLSTENFMRIRMGVGEKPKGYDLADYVLGHFSGAERDMMDKASIEATEAIRSILNDGIDIAMGKYNRKNEGTNSAN